MKKYLLVLDFDNTITDWDGSLGLKRGDKIAHLLLEFVRRFNIDPILLSIANKAHILSTVEQSQSKLLMEIIENIPLITEEFISSIPKLNRNREESVKKKNKMIMEVFGDPDLLNHPDAIRAYKKTNSLQRIAKLHNLSPKHIFFLDDNPYNILFAKSYGFNAHQVFNRSKQQNIFSLLEKIEKKIN